MKAQHFFVTLCAVFFCADLALAAAITFTSSGTITEGDVYTGVSVQNAGTIVDMSGGQVSNYVSIFNEGMLNFSGGTITAASILVEKQSFLSVMGGTINLTDAIAVMSGGTCNIAGGNVTVRSLKTYPENSISSVSLVNINGGNLNVDIFDIHGVVNIYRGSLYVKDTNMGNWPDDQAVINIYGGDFNYNIQTNILTGCLLDGNLFTIKGVDALEYTRFNLIPEPASILTLGCSALWLFGKFRSKKQV